VGGCEKKVCEVGSSSWWWKSAGQSSAGVKTSWAAMRVSCVSVSVADEMASSLWRRRGCESSFVGGTTHGNLCVLWKKRWSVMV